MNLVNKTLNLNLTDVDGNASNLLDAFKKQAIKEKWSQDEINKVIIEAESGDYDHLVYVLFEHTNVDEFNDEEFEEIEENEDDDEIY